MRIISLTLKNIRSFDEGADGQGVRVDFTPGVNVIAGRNGHGKTTIIESIGYALFRSKPSYEANFDVKTYFLRSGCSEGSISITFEAENQIYTVFRPMGGKLRDKIISEADGAICAENENETRIFLNQCLGLGTVSGEDVFKKLIGVKQGQLTWPYDAKASQSKAHFDSILNVEGFRKCFADLKPVEDRFSSELHEFRVKTSTLEERIAGLQVPQEEMTFMEDRLLTSREAEAQAEKAAQEAKDQRVFYEAREIAVKASQDAETEARHVLSLAIQSVEQARTSSEESISAQSHVDKSKAGHAGFLKCEEEMGRLRVRRSSLATQQKELEKRIKTKTQHVTRYAEFEATQKSTSSQLKELLEEIHNTKAERESIQSDQERSRMDELALESRAEKARPLVNRIRESSRELQQMIFRIESAADRVVALRHDLSDWDPESLPEARSRYEGMESKIATLDKERVRRQEALDLTERQFDSLKTGQCPILMEPCRQYNGSRVAMELDEERAALGGIDQELRELRESARAAKTVAQTRETADLKARSDIRLLEDEERRHAEFCHEIQESSSSLAEQFATLWPDHSPAPLPIVDGAQDWRRWFSSWNGWREEALRIANQLEHEWSECHSRQRVRREKLQDLSSRIQTSENREQSLVRQIDSIEEEKRTLGKELDSLDADISALEAQVSVLPELDALWDRLEEEKSTCREAHDQWVRYSPTAALREERLAAYTQRVLERDKAEANLALKTEARRAAGLEYQPEDADRARDRERDAAIAYTQAQGERRTAEKSWEDLQMRESKRREAQAELEGLRAEVKVLEAGLLVTKKARTTLRDSADKVADHLCRSVAAAAQDIFMTIHPDPIELIWQSNGYQLLLKPGERRFAMLSGGEQTKLALAMNLAMIQKFTSLRFCILDEPTYGIDRESREPLADAIFQAAKDARLEQLLLVSHDDTFVGRADSTFTLQKSGAKGTRVVDQY